MKIGVVKINDSIYNYQLNDIELYINGDTASNFLIKILSKEEKRICNKCGQPKNIEEFRYYKSGNRLTYYRRGRCADCKKKETRDNNRKHRMKYSNPEQRKRKEKNRIKNLSECYMVKTLKTRFGISRKTIRQYPELIESYRMQIKTKRLLKNKRHERENIKTSESKVALCNLV